MYNFVQKYDFFSLFLTVNLPTIYFVISWTDFYLKNY